MSETLNELIDKLREGEIDTIELDVSKEGHINKIIIRNTKKESKEEIEKVVKKVQLEDKSLKEIDFSDTDITGSDFSELNLEGADFSGTRIHNTNLSLANLSGASFRRAHIIKTDFSYAQGVITRDAYITGAVNLYRTNEPLPPHYKIKHGHQRKDNYDMSIKQGPGSWWVEEDKNKPGAYEVLHRD